MAVPFSETQFAFSIVFEIMNSRPFYFMERYLPYFPTLFDEKLLGFDVKIGANLFLQFKLSDYKDSLSAKHYKVFKSDFYKHYFSKYSEHQFRTLKSLSKKFDSVYYVFPEFHTPHQLNHYLLNKEIIKNSAFFNLSDFPPSMSGHNLVFTPYHDKAYICSEPVEIRKVAFPANLDSFQSKSRQSVIEIVLSALPDYYSDEFKGLNSQGRNSTVSSVAGFLWTHYNILWLPFPAWV